MNKIRYIAILLLMLAGGLHPATATAAENGEVDVNHLVFGHIGDAYEWHIATLVACIVSGRKIHGTASLGGGFQNSLVDGRSVDGVSVACGSVTGHIIDLCLRAPGKKTEEE